MRSCYLPLFIKETNIVFTSDALQGVYSPWVHARSEPPRHPPACCFVKASCFRPIPWPLHAEKVKSAIYQTARGRREEGFVRGYSKLTRCSRAVRVESYQGVPSPRLVWPSVIDLLAAPCRGDHFVVQRREHCYSTARVTELLPSRFK
jgi:hypothetical protein